MVMCNVLQSFHEATGDERVLHERLRQHVRESGEGVHRANRRQPVASRNAANANVVTQKPIG